MKISIIISTFLPHSLSLSISLSLTFFLSLSHTHTHTHYQQGSPTKKGLGYSQHDFDLSRRGSLHSHGSMHGYTTLTPPIKGPHPPRKSVTVTVRETSARTFSRGWCKELSLTRRIFFFLS